MDGQTVVNVAQEVAAVVPQVQQEVQEIKAAGKKWYESKTVWINFLLLAAGIAQFIAGKEIISAGDQAAIITVINLILRAITKENIVW